MNELIDRLRGHHGYFCKHLERMRIMIDTKALEAITADLGETVAALEAGAVTTAQAADAEAQAKAVAEAIAATQAEDQAAHDTAVAALQAEIDALKAQLVTAAPGDAPAAPCGSASGTGPADGGTDPNA